MSQQEMSMKPQGSVQGSAAPPGYGQLQYGGQQPPAQGMPANYGQQQHLPPGYEQGPPQYGAAPPPPGGHSHGSFAPSVPPPGNMPAGKPPGPMMAPYAPGQATYNEEDEFNDPSGKYKLVKKGAYAAVECAVTPGDLVKAEGGAMVTMSSNVSLKAKLEGSLGMALFRSCCAGEGMFMSHFDLMAGNRGDLLLAPAVPGEIIMIHMDGQREWHIQKQSYMACDQSIDISVKTQGLAAGCCSGEGFFILKARGQGRLLVNSFGGIMRYDLQPGEVRKMDNGYLVAWEGHMQYSIGKAGDSLIGSFLSGEGFVCTFTGPGRVYVQTRSIGPFAMAIRPYVQPGGGGGGGAGGALGSVLGSM